MLYVVCCMLCVVCCVFCRLTCTCNLYFLGCMKKPNGKEREKRREGGDQVDTVDVTLFRYHVRRIEQCVWLVVV
jgi:hypothetical protein